MSSSVNLWRTAILALLAAFSVAHGVVLHNSSMPTDRPADVIVGRWGSNASCVAVGDDYIATTRHQGGGVGTTVVLGGVSYRVAESTISPSDASMTA